MQTQHHIPVSAETNTEKLYDLCMVEKLCRGNQQQVRQMIQVFIDRVPQSIEEIKTAYKKSDFSAVKKAAHQIKPVLSFYAIVKVEKDVQQIESLAAAERATSEFDSIIQKLEMVIFNIVAQMKNTFLYQ